MKATELAEMLTLIIDDIDALEKQTAAHRRIRTLLSAARISSGHLIRDENILARQGKEYFNNTPAVEQKIIVVAEQISTAELTSKKDNIKKPKV